MFYQQELPLAHPKDLIKRIICFRYSFDREAAFFTRANEQTAGCDPKLSFY